VNFIIGKHALVQAEEMGINLRQAVTRLFSNASGSYSSNVNLAIEIGILSCLLSDDFRKYYGR
jgi:hypothetical protein